MKEKALERFKVGNASWVESNGHWEMTICFRRLLSSLFQHIYETIHFNLSVAIEGRRRRKKNGWTKIEKELKKGYFSSRFHLKRMLVCSSATGGIEDPWHQQTQIWLKCSHCWLRTSEWHLLSARRDAFRGIAAGEDGAGCDFYHTVDCQVVWGVRRHVTRVYFVLWCTWSIYSKAIVAALRG